jgi:hypothetical protein
MVLFSKILDNDRVQHQHMNLLQNGGKVLVVGARRSNAPEYWDHPQCVFLEGSDASARGIPANARAIVFTRFLSHSHFAPLVQEARDRHLTIFPVQGTGQLKETLKMLLTKSEPKPESQQIAPKPKPPVPLLPSPSIPDIPENIPAMNEPTTNSPVQTRGHVKEYMKNLLKEKSDLRISEAVKLGVAAGHNNSSLTSAFYALTRGKRVQKRAPRTRVASAPRAQERAIESSSMIQTLDEAIAALQLVREEILKNERGLEKLKNLRELLGNI